MVTKDNILFYVFLCNFCAIHVLRSPSRQENCWSTETKNVDNISSFQMDVRVQVNQSEAIQFALHAEVC